MRFAVPVLLLLLVACAAPQPRPQGGWKHDGGAGQAQFKRDWGQCEAQVQSATGRSASQCVGECAERGMRILFSCMNGKGWQWVQQ